MLKNEIRETSLFNDLKPFADSLNLSIVDVYKNVKNQKDIQVCIVVYNKNEDTSIDDCEHFHRAVQPRLELTIDREILSMEVSTPGLQRVIKDVYEFSVFKGKQARVYSSQYSSWIEGCILDSDSDSVTLGDYLIVDTAISGSSLQIPFTDIQKAKLDYKFENKKSGDK